MYGKDTRLHELSTEVWDRTLAVNLRGHWLCAKYVIPPCSNRGKDASSTSLRPRA